MADNLLGLSKGVTKDPLLSYIASNPGRANSGMGSVKDPQTGETYEMGSIFRQLDIGAAGPSAERNAYTQGAIDFLKGTVMQASGEGRTLDITDRVMASQIVSSFTGRPVEEVLPSLDRYIKAYTGADSAKGLLKAFQDSFESYSNQRTISRMTNQLLDIPYDSPRRQYYEGRLEEEREKLALKTANVSMESGFLRQVANSGNIVAQGIEQAQRTLISMMLFNGIAGVALEGATTPAIMVGADMTKRISTIQQVSQQSAQMFGAAANTFMYSITTMAESEKAETAQALMDLRDDDGNRIPLDIIRKYSDSYGLLSAMTEIMDNVLDFTPIGRLRIGATTIGEFLKPVTSVLQNFKGSIPGIVAFGAANIGVQSAQEGLQSFIRDTGFNEAVKESNALGYTRFDLSSSLKSVDQRMSSSWEEFKDSVIPMGVSQLLTGGVTIGAKAVAQKAMTVTVDLSRRMSVTKDMKATASKYFKTDGKYQTVDIGYIDTMGEDPEDLSQKKGDGEEATQEDQRREPPMVTIDPVTGAMVPVLRTDRAYIEALREQGVTGVNVRIVNGGRQETSGGRVYDAGGLGAIKDEGRSSLLNMIGAYLNSSDDNYVTGYSNGMLIVKDEESRNKVLRMLSDNADMAVAGRFAIAPIRDGNTSKIEVVTQEEAHGRGVNARPLIDWSEVGIGRRPSFRMSKDEYINQSRTQDSFVKLLSRVIGIDETEARKLFDDDFDSIEAMLPAGVTMENLTSAAMYMPIMSDITGRSVSDLLSDGMVSFEVTGDSFYVDVNTNSTLRLDEATGRLRGKDLQGNDVDYAIDDTANVARAGADTKTENGYTTIRIYRDAKAEDITHELMHMTRRLASPERLEGFKAAYGAQDLWIEDIKDNGDGTFTFNGTTYDSYRKAFEQARVNEERFVNDFFRYLSTAEAPNEQVRGFFEGLKRLLNEILQKFREILDPSTVRAFDRLLSGDLEVRQGQTVDEALEASEATLIDEVPFDEEGLLSYNDYSDEAEEAGLDAEGNRLYSLSSDRQWQTMDANTQRRIDADYERVYNEYHGTDKWMKAPNGQPTNLTERQWVQVRTPAFKAWFGDWENDPENASKVVDENGEPLVVYHGTNADFDTFMHGESVTSELLERNKNGFFFTDNRKVAESYQTFGSSDGESFSPRVLEVFLNSRDPLIADAIQGGKWSNLFEEAKKNENDGLVVQNLIDVRGRALSKSEMKYYGNANDYVVFESNQIKSATDNVGTFSNENDNTLYSLTEVDRRYFEAINSNDMDTAQAIVNRLAEERGYFTDSSYQGTSAFNGKAPSTNAYYETKEERRQAYEDEEFEGDASLGDYKEGIDPMNLELFLTNPNMARTVFAKESVKNIKNGLKNGTITMYRSVPENVVESSFRNGDWVTPSKAYAIDNAEIHGWDGYNIIEQTVSIDDIWWDGNDINEWGYDDGNGYAYQNTENNRKLLDVITRDENGNIIPPSQRFNPDNDSILYSLVYHGSGADFDEFLESKIGSGQGSQNFGYGFYLTESDIIGKGYASDGEVTEEAKQEYVRVARWELEDAKRTYERAKASADATFAEKGESLSPDDRMRIEEKLRDYRSMVAFAQESYDRAVAMEVRRRNLYKVEIPDNDGTNYFDWNKVYSKEEVQPIIDAAKAKQAPEYRASFEKDYLLDRSDVFYGGSLYGMLSAALYGDRRVSNLLSDLGYVGVVYDAGTNMGLPEGVEKGTRNYVIFPKNKNQIKMVKHWTYDTDQEAESLYSLSPARQAEVIAQRKADIQRAVEAGIFVRTEYLNEFRGEEWAQDELNLRDWMGENPDVVSMAKEADTLEDFRKAYEKSMSDSEGETEPSTDTSEDSGLADSWFERIFSYAHALSSEDRDRQFANEWTATEDKTLELARTLANYRDAFWKAKPQSRSGGYWYTRNVWGAFKGVSTKLLKLSDGKGRRTNQRTRSSSAEIQEVQNLIRSNPRAYRNALMAVMMAESRASQVNAGLQTGIGADADWMQLEQIDDDISQEISEIEEKAEDARRLKTDYRANLQDIRQKISDAERDIRQAGEDPDKLDVDGINEDLKGIRQRVKELSSMISGAEREVDRIIERMGGNIEKIEDKSRKDLEAKRARIRELRSQLTEERRNERRLQSALDAKTRLLEAREAKAYREKRRDQILRLSNFNSGSIDASFEESLLWVQNVFERSEEDIDFRRSIDEEIAEKKKEIDTLEFHGENADQSRQELLTLQKQKRISRMVEPPAQLAMYLPEGYLVRADNRQSMWTAEELDTLLSALKLMRADGRQMLESREAQRSALLLGIAYSYFREVVGRNARVDEEGAMSSGALRQDVHESLKEGKEANGFRRYKLWNAKLQRLARILDGDREGVLYDWFVRRNYQHQSEEITGIRRRLDAGSAEWKRLGLKSSELKKEGYKGTKTNGTEYSLTRAQMIGVYIYNNQELGREKLTHANGNALSEESISEIVSLLTPEEKAWADFMVRDLSDNYSRLRDVYYRVWNMILGERANYFTFVPADSVSQALIDSMGIDPQGDLVGHDGKMYVDKSFTKQINPNAIYPMNLDVTQTWARQVRKQEHFIAYGEWAKDTQYLLDKGQLMETMGRVIGLTEARNFEKIVNSVIGGQMSNNDFDRAWIKVLCSRNSAVLIGNTGTIIKQAPSFFAAFNGDISLRHLINGDRTLQNFLEEHPDILEQFPDIDKAVDFIYANAPEMKDRQIDIDIMDSLNAMDNGAVTEALRRANNKISRYTMQYVDRMVVNALWMSRYYTVFDEQKALGRTDMDAHAEAAFKASQFISETQPTSMRMDQAAVQVDAKTSSKLRGIMVFTNQVVNTFNQMFLDVPMAFRQKNWRKVIAKIASSMLMVGVTAMISGKFWRRGNEDDEKYLFRFAREILATAVQAMMPGFGSIFAAGLEYDSDYSSYIFGLDTLGSSLRKVLSPSGNKDAWEKIADVMIELGTEAGYAIGVPVTPIKNVVKAVENRNPAYLLTGTWGQIVESYR